MLEKFEKFEIEKEKRNQVLGGEDRLRFLASVTLNDGRNFSSSNTGTNIISSASS